MGRIAKQQSTQEFQSILRYVAAEGDTNACFPISVAIMTGLPFKTVNDAFLAAGRVKGRGTYVWVARQACRALGYEMVEAEWREYHEIIARYPGQHKNLKCITTYHPTRFEKAWKGIGDCLLMTATHIAAYKDGALHDWSNDKALRVIKIFRLVKIL